MSDDLKKASPTDITATVRIRIEVEVTVGNWSPAESFNGLRDQAIREATQQLQGVINKAASSIKVIGPAKSMHVSLVGEFK